LRDRPDNGGKKAEREVPQIFILRWKGVRWTRDLGESVGPKVAVVKVTQVTSGHAAETSDVQSDERL
jgi:hypothetical protein